MFRQLESQGVFHVLSVRYMKVFLLGSTGYIGKAILGVYPDAITERVDITDRSAVADALDRIKPDVVINAAGKTGRPNVDWCEDHKLETLQANVIGPLNLLQECGARNIYWVHMSSGCIYSGDNGGRGFTEDDPPNFWGSFYARTKAWSDQILREFPVLQLRLRMPFDGTDEPRNLIQKLLKYRKVLDEPNSLTYVPDFLETMRSLVEKKATGTFNVVNPGTVSPWRIIELYKESVDPAHNAERLPLDGLGTVVKAGRSNCLLSGEKLMAQGIVLPDIEVRLKEAMAALKAVR